MIKRHLLSPAFALLILWLSFSNPGTFSEMNLPDIPHLDKLVHTAMYFVFTFLLIIENREKLISPLRYLILASIPFLFGSIIEILQSVLTDFRSGDLFDAMFNVAGIGLAILSWNVLKKLFFKEA